MKKKLFILITLFLVAASAPAQAQVGNMLKKAKEKVEKKTEAVKEAAPGNKPADAVKSPSQSRNHDKVPVPVTSLESDSQPAPPQPWEIASDASLEGRAFVGGKMTKGSVTATLEKGVLKIKGTGQMKDFNDQMARPWGSLKNEITSIVIEEGIGNIGDLAFIGLANLTSVKLPKSMKEFGTKVFASCTSLKTMKYLLHTKVL